MCSHSSPDFWAQLWLPQSAWNELTGCGQPHTLLVGQSELLMTGCPSPPGSHPLGEGACWGARKYAPGGGPGSRPELGVAMAALMVGRAPHPTLTLLTGTSPPALMLSSCYCFINSKKCYLPLGSSCSLIPGASYPCKSKVFGVLGHGFRIRGQEQHWGDTAQVTIYLTSGQRLS